MRIFHAEKDGLSMASSVPYHLSHRVYISCRQGHMDESSQLWFLGASITAIFHLSIRSDQ